MSGDWGSRTVSHMVYKTALGSFLTSNDSKRLQCYNRAVSPYLRGVEDCGRFVTSSLASLFTRDLFFCRVSASGILSISGLAAQQAKPGQTNQPATVPGRGPLRCSLPKRARSLNEFDTFPFSETARNANFTFVTRSSCLNDKFVSVARCIPPAVVHPDLRTRTQLVPRHADH